MKVTFTKEQEKEYLALAHSIQSGVAAEIGITNSHTPKHLRTGVNMAMCEHAGLVELLIKKGIISMGEYAESTLAALRGEKKRYEKVLSSFHKRNIKL